MKKIRSISLSTIGFLVVLILAAGCYRPAAPDVTPTVAGEAEAAGTATAEPSEGEPTEEDPDMLATGAANATLAAEGEESEATAEPTEAPTEPPSSPSPTPSEETETPAPTVEPTAVPEEPSTSTETTVHVVQPGENLFRIALRYNMTTEALAQANGIANPRLIYVGQKLTIPTGAQPSPAPGGETTYTVKPGDNLFRIALRYNMSHLYLARYNGITNPSQIYVGQVLKIPPR